MTTKEAKENILRNYDACRATATNMDMRIFLMNSMEQLVKIAQDEFVDEYTNELKQRNRIIAVLLDKLGGQSRIFDYEMLNLPERSDVIGEVSRADNSTLFTLRK